MRCLLDMDGVLTDFVGGVCLAHRRESPYKDGANVGCFDMEQPWGMTKEEFWTPLNSYAFWRRLGKTPEADDLITLAGDIFGLDNVCLLTSPSTTGMGECVEGKKKWVEINFPELAGRVIFTFAKNKRFLAQSGAVLVDDYDKNVEAFRSAGGQAILVPRPWNAAWKQSKQCLTVVREALISIRKEYVW